MAGRTKIKTALVGQVVLNMVTYILAWIGKSDIICSLPWLHMLLFGFYAYTKYKVCPLEIAWRVHPSRWIKAMRRMYPQAPDKMLLIYGPFPILLVVAIVDKIVLLFK